jgi:hypothetical protein
MFVDITEVKTLPDLKLWLKFADGISGTVDLKDQLRFDGIFAPLKNPDEFAKVHVDPEWGGICWPNGADLDTEVLYSLVTKKPINLQVP